MIKKKESDMSNFQIAAGTLDASTKIYAYRVDAVYGDTLKIASGLGQTAKQAEAGDNNDNLDEEGNKKKSRKRLKKSSTVEKNLKNINVAKFELEFEVDPLFKKTSSQFDGAAGGNQFLATLNLRDETCELLLDSDTRVDSVLPNDVAETEEEQAPRDLVEVQLPPLQDLDICPTFSTFSFTTWSLDQEEDDDYNRLNDSISQSQEERAAHGRSVHEEHAFDMFAVPEPIDNDNIDDGMVDYDDNMDHNGMDGTEWSERLAGAQMARPGLTATLPMTTADMLSALTTAPLEYSYFDHGKIGAWAGPKHWKFKPLSRIATGELEKGKGRKKKVVECLDYDEFDERLEDVLQRVEKLLELPKKSVKLVDKTMKGWNRERSTLPEDLHYSGHELVRLKTVDRMVVAKGKNLVSGTIQLDEVVPDYDYDNAADNDGFCPGIDDDYDDAYDANEVNDNPASVSTSEVTDNPASVSTVDTDTALHMAMAAEDHFAGDNLVEAPKTVDKAALAIGYAKTAKKIDMKRIKATTWAILTREGREASLGASPEKQTADADTSSTKKSVDAMVGEVRFSEMFKQLKLPSRLPSKMSENLSVPLSFISLLHLCNEKTLALDGTELLDDFIIKQG